MLLAGALVSLGLAVSALTANQIVAAVISLGIFGILWSIDSFAALLPPPIDNWFLGLSLLARFTPFAVGAMYTSDFGFFLAAHSAWPVPDRSRAGEALKRWTSIRSSSHRCSGQPAGWPRCWCCSGQGCGCRCRRVSGDGRTGSTPAASSSPGSALFALANVALTLHDGHIDLTREKIYTPSAAAMRVVDGLGREVRVTYFYHSQDPAGRRARDILDVMQRRNPLFRLTAVDPDKEPTVARTNGIRIYNAAMIEADGRRVLVQSTDEAEIALGVQRVLRERVITVCFIEGHGELPMDNFEFHTHLEGVVDHSHDDASSRAGADGRPRRRALPPRARGAGLRNPPAHPRHKSAKFPTTARWWSRPTRAPRSCPAKAPRCAPIWRTAGPRCFCSTSASCSSPGLRG